MRHLKPETESQPVTNQKGLGANRLAVMKPPTEQSGAPSQGGSGRENLSPNEVRASAQLSPCVLGVTLLISSSRECGDAALLVFQGRRGVLNAQSPKESRSSVMCAAMKHYHDCRWPCSCLIDSTVSSSWSLRSRRNCTPSPHPNCASDTKFQEDKCTGFFGELRSRLPRETLTVWGYFSLH